MPQKENSHSIDYKLQVVNMLRECTRRVFSLLSVRHVAEQPSACDVVFYFIVIVICLS